jgi:hypothetical protein
MPIKKSNNPFAGKAKPAAGKKKGTGKWIGKSKVEKANNQLNFGDCALSTCQATPFLQGKRVRARKQCCVSLKLE